MVKIQLYCINCNIQIMSKTKKPRENEANIEQILLIDVKKYYSRLLNILVCFAKVSFSTLLTQPLNTHTYIYCKRCV